MKTFLIIFMALCFHPFFSEADLNAQTNYHITKKGNAQGNGPHMMPVNPLFFVDIDSVTGVLTLCFNADVDDIHLVIAQDEDNIMEDDCFDAVFGQIVTYNLSGYDTGEYQLIIEVDDEIIAEYILTVEV